MPDTNILIQISKDLATNTEVTKGIESDVNDIKVHLNTLNGKVADNVREISTLKRNLLVIGTVAATLLITQGSELVNFILKLI